MASRPQLLTGSRGVVKFKPANSNEYRVLGFVTDVGISESAGLRPSYVIGAEGPVTIEPVSYDVNCSFSRLVPINDIDGKALDLLTAVDHEFEARLVDFLRTNTVEVAVYDKGQDGTDVVIGIVREARFSGKSIGMGAQDVATERYNFVGIYDGGYGDAKRPGPLGYES